LQVFNLLAQSHEIEMLDAKPISSASILKEQQRLQQVYHYVEMNYQKEINVNDVAATCHLTTAAFCRYFKKQTHYTFTDFLNHYRINQSKKLLMQDCSVTEVCYQTGFANISYFNKMFKKLTGENPSHYRKHHLT
jgi:YesN/AraC family two-component response regulator